MEFLNIGVGSFRDLRSASVHVAIVTRRSPGIRCLWGALCFSTCHCSFWGFILKMHTF